MKTRFKVIVVLLVAAAAVAAVALKKSQVATPADAKSTGGPATSTVGLPRLIDVGAGQCIPCKLMAPILEELKREYAGQLVVEFIDVRNHPKAGEQYAIEIIPTQIFYDSAGKELFRHEGFIGKEDILAKWKQLGVKLTAPQAAALVREEPVKPDTRARDQVCFLCDADIPTRSKTVVRGEQEQRQLCSVHCYFIYYSSLVGADAKGEDAKLNVTDWAGGQAVPALAASYVYGLDAEGRPTIKAFADAAAARKEQQVGGGNIIGWPVLRAKELANRCAFCDRAVYPEDACRVKFGSTSGYGCCSHCSLGVAARWKQDVAIEAKDGLTGDPIRVQTFAGQVATLDPPTAIAWFGQKKTPEGKWVSAGCFKQGFFVTQTNLQRWLAARPAMTGRQITIAQALADKMKLTPEQIAQACKLGECK